MRSTRLLFWLRRLVAALLVVSLVATPALAAAESPESHSEITFACDDEAEVSGESRHAHDAHGHAAHGCGTCHFHWLGSKAEMPVFPGRVAPAGADVTVAPLVRLAAMGPYRPPRG